MSSETTTVARNFRLQEWATQIRECQDRPAGMRVADWCACHGITKADYYAGTARGRNWRPVHIWDPFGAATQKPSATSHTCSQEHGHYEGMPDRTLFA